MTSFMQIQTVILTWLNEKQGVAKKITHGTDHYKTCQF